jgi:hypothetical protein
VRSGHGPALTVASDGRPRSPRQMGLPAAEQRSAGERIAPYRR